MTIANDQGTCFKVVIIKNGDNYGLNNCLAHKEDDPLVEFYYTDYFVSRYYLSTLEEHGRKEDGVSLKGSRPELYITAENKRKVIEFVKYELKPDIVRSYIKGKWTASPISYCDHLKFRDERVLSWKEELISTMKYKGETWDDMIDHTMTKAELYGLPNGKPFKLWSTSRVYFPIDYDGHERILSVPRYPEKNKTKEEL